jgi:hypothetical protein
MEEEEVKLQARLAAVFSEKEQVVAALLLEKEQLQKQLAALLYSLERRKKAHCSRILTKCV